MIWRAADETAWHEVLMTPAQPAGLDIWKARIPLDRMGRHEFTVIAWRDDFASLVEHIQKKLKAGQTVELELDDGTRRHLTASVGLIEYPLFPDAPGLLGWEQMVTLADRALYRAKSAGRNTWSAYRPRPGAQAPSAQTFFEGDPSWLVDAGLLEPFGPVDAAVAGDTAGDTTALNPQ